MSPAARNRQWHRRIRGAYSRTFTNKRRDAIRCTLRSEIGGMMHRELRERWPNGVTTQNFDEISEWQQARLYELHEAIEFFVARS